MRGSAERKGFLNPPNEVAYNCGSFKGQHDDRVARPAAPRGKWRFEGGLQEGAKRPLRGAFCDHFSIPSAPLRGPRQFSRRLSQIPETECTKIAHRHSLAIFTADEGIAGNFAVKSVLSILVAEKIAVR